MGGNQFLDTEPKFQIRSKKLLLVEGIDDQAVFDSLSKKMGVSDIQILRYDGKPKFRNFVEDLTSLDGFDEVEMIGITTDVDQNPVSARDRIRGALENASLPVPNQPLIFAEEPDAAKVAYLLIPHESEHGELEDVCLDSVDDEVTLNCVDDFMSCFESNGSRITRPSKSKLQAYLSTQEDPDKRIGEAVMAGYLPYDADAFEPLRSLLEMLHQH